MTSLVARDRGDARGTSLPRSGRPADERPNGSLSPASSTTSIPTASPDPCRDAGNYRGGALIPPPSCASSRWTYPAVYALPFPARRRPPRRRDRPDGPLALIGALARRHAPRRRGCACSARSSAAGAGLAILAGALLFSMVQARDYTRPGPFSPSKMAARRRSASPTPSPGAGALARGYRAGASGSPAPFPDGVDRRALCWADAGIP